MKIEELPSDTEQPHHAAPQTPQAEDAEVDLLSAALNSLPTSTLPKTSDELIAELNAHPLFMTDIVENDELEALKALQYEGTPLEIATNFKEQGNEVFKIKRWVDAKEFYNKGVAVLIAEVRKRQKENKKKSTDTGDVRQEVALLESLLVNRAACHLELKNYRSCTLDCTAALGINPKNIKAHYRSSKALLALHRISDADDACAKGLEIDPENVALKAIAKEIIKRHEQITARKAKELAQAQRKLLEEQTLKAALKARGIKVRRTAQPPEMEDTKISLVPDPVDPTSSVTFPTVLLYPLQLESDFIKGFGETESLGDHLSYMLPTPWDQKGEYTPVGVECYMETITGGLVKVGRKVTLLKVLAAGNVEVVDEVVKIFVVPKAKAPAWIEDFKRKKAAELPVKTK